MSLPVTCPSCHQSFSAAPHLHGTTVGCPNCATPLAIPTAAQPTYPPAQLPNPVIGTPAPVLQVQTPRRRSAGNSQGKLWMIVAGVLLLPILACGLLGVVVTVMVGGEGTPTHDNLMDARAEHTTRLTSRQRDGSAVPTPPPQLFLHEKYATTIGEMSAYVSPSPNDGQRHPAIIWKFGGFSNSIDETAWMAAPLDNDQSASAYREAGIIMMYPSVRGGNQNPGHFEGLYGEVDDMLAAADHLAQKDYVDPNRIYLGGHSTGGTLALLVAASTDRFRGVIAFGPVARTSDYGDVPYSTYDRTESRLRAPSRWLHAIRTPTYIFEGTDGNSMDLLEMRRKADADVIRCFLVAGTDHFGILGPVNRLVAQKVVADIGPTCNLSFTQQELDRLFR